MSEDNDKDDDRDVTAKNSNITNGWKNPPKVSDLKADFTNAKTSFDKHVTQVGEYLDYFHIKGTAKRTKQRNRSNIQPKTIRTQAEWRYPNLTEPFLSTQQVFTIEPATFADGKAATQNELLINHQFNTKMDKVALIDNYARTLVNEGTAVLRVGWYLEEGLEEHEDPQYSFVPIQDPQEMQQYQQQYQQIGAMMAQGAKAQLSLLEPELLIGFRMSQQLQQLVKAVVTEVKIKKIKSIKENKPTVEVCDYRRVMIDPLCKGDIDKAQFVIYEFETSLSDLKKETDKYTNLDNLSGKSPNSNLDDDVLTNLDDEAYSRLSSFNYKDKARKKFMAYEYWGYWDYDGTGIAEPFVATWVGDTMIRLEENPFPDKKIPFVLVQYLPKVNKLYGEPDGALLKDNQSIIGALTRGMVDVMGRAATGQRACRQDALDIVNKRKFEQGLDIEYQGNVDPNSIFHTFQFPEIPQSATLMLQQQNAEAEALTGVKAFSTGGNGISGAGLGESATAARGALDAASKREIAILRRMSEGMKKVARKIVAMNAIFLNEEEVIRITDEEFVKVTREELRGEFNLHVKITTAEDDNAKAEELAFMLQTGAADADPEEVRMIRSEIAELRKMPELAKKIREFQPQPDPAQQEMQRLQIELLKAQIQNEQSKAHENKANGDYDLARVPFEQAKAQLAQAQAQLQQSIAIEKQASARKLEAEADQIDLNYIEQEKGVTQEREKEKIDLQHRATMMQKEKDIEKEKISHTLQSRRDAQSQAHDSAKQSREHASKSQERKDNHTSTIAGKQHDRYTAIEQKRLDAHFDEIAKRSDQERGESSSKKEVENSRKDKAEDHKRTLEIKDHDRKTAILKEKAKPQKPTK